MSSEQDRRLDPNQTFTPQELVNALNSLKESLGDENDAITTIDAIIAYALARLDATNIVFEWGPDGLMRPVAQYMLTINLESLETE